MAGLRPNPPFLGVYLHVPFCSRKCAYCGFYSVAYRDDIARQYVEAVTREAESASKSEARTIYIGGGTPSILSVSLIEKLLCRLKKTFPGIAEFSIEANPDSLDMEKALIMKNAGVTRVSIGLQSTSPGVLATIGRNCKTYSPVSIMEILAGAGFAPEQVSFDVIYGINGQSLQDIEETLTAVIETHVAHVSLYGFTLEDDSRVILTKHRPVAPDETYSEHYFLMDRLLAGNGFLRYEVSNYAKSGYECIHNLNYWKGGEWHGFGPAASATFRGKGGTVRFTNAPDLKDYIEAVCAGKKPSRTVEHLTKEEELEEHVFLMLRLAEGLDVTELNRRFGAEYAAHIEKRALNLIRRGFLEERGGRLAIPSAHVLLTDEITVDILSGA